LTLNEDGSFRSFYKPSNHKVGSWRIVSDTVFRLHMKAVDDYIVQELTTAF
jgi:hypothetical protein